MNMTSHEERNDEELEQAQYILKWLQRKEDKKKTRRMHMMFWANTKN